MGPSGETEEYKMAKRSNIKQMTAIRIWNWRSKGVNHPNMCAPSEWLIGQLAASFPSEKISDEIWKLARRSLVLLFPGLDRPLGSCYHPVVADVLDVAYYYKSATQRVFRKVAAVAAEIVHANEGLWLVESEEGDEYLPSGTRYIPPTARRKGAHVSECPRLLEQLAVAIRANRAPAIEGIRPLFFEKGWNDTRMKEMLGDTEAKRKFATIAELLLEFQISVVETTEAHTINVAERWYDNWHCPRGRCTNRWFTDGEKVELSAEVLENPHGYFSGGGLNSFRIEKPSFAFSLGFTPGNGGGRQGSHNVSKLYLWPDYDPEVVIKALKEALKN